MCNHDLNQFVLDPPSSTKFHFQIIFFSKFVFNLSRDITTYVI